MLDIYSLHVIFHILLIPFSYGGNGYAERSEHTQNLTEMCGFLAFLQIDDERRPVPAIPARSF